MRKVFSMFLSSITRSILLASSAIFILNLRSFAAENPAGPVKILAYGDSITAGYRMDRNFAFPFLLEERLKAMGHNVTVINAGISGDTSAQGVQRLPWILKHHPKLDLVLLELGANDGLRGLPVSEMKKNLSVMIQKFRENGKPEIVVFGMQTTKNLSENYRREFEAAFPAIAKKEGALYLPFLLEKVAFNPEFTLDDLIHPNQKGHKALADAIFKFMDARGVWKRLFPAK